MHVMTRDWKCCQSRLTVRLRGVSKLPGDFFVRCLKLPLSDITCWILDAAHGTLKHPQHFDRNTRNLVRLRARIWPSDTFADNSRRCAAVQAAAIRLSRTPASARPANIHWHRYCRLGRHWIRTISGRSPRTASTVPRRSPLVQRSAPGPHTWFCVC